MSLALMQAQLDALRATAEVFETDLVADPFLFSDHPAGSKPWRPGAITQYFARLRERTGLKHVQYKGLRAFMDTYGQDLGFSLAQVALRAGHDPAVASKHYTGRVTETDRRLAEALAGLIAG